MSPGRVVVVTGAGKGLGRAFAEAWAARGARVVVSNRRRPEEPDSAAEVAAAVRARGGEAVAETSDVRDPEAGASLARKATEAWGRLDAVILNAGVNGPAARFDSLDASALREVMEINFFANVALAQAMLPLLRESDSPRLLFVSSSAGLYGVRGRAAYAASKGAVTSLALTLAHEERRHGVGVNVLAPYAATRMTAEGEAGAVPGRLTPEAAAPAAVWLTGPTCTRTGEVWVTGGGWSRRAQAEEGVGAAPPPGVDLTPEWLEGHAERLADMGGGRGFRGAEAAFSDFASRL